MEGEKPMIGFAANSKQVPTDDPTNQEVGDLENKLGNYRQWFSRYEPNVKRMLEKLSVEQIESLGKKKFYHVTSIENIQGIKEGGLKMSTLIKKQEDFEFLNEMFEKYGIPDSRRYFDSLIMGRSNESGKAISLSVRPDIEAYFIPERVRLMIRNLILLSKASYVSETEKERCALIVEKYKTEYKKEHKVYVVNVSFMAPPIINQLCGGYFDEPIDFVLPTLLRYRDVDYKQNTDISPEYLEIVEGQVPTEEYFNQIFVDPGSETSCFRTDHPGNQIDVTRLSPEGKIMYQKFIDTYGKPPTELEFRAMFR